MPRSRTVHYDATTPDIAALLHCDAVTVRRLYTTGKIPGIRLNRELRFNTVAVLAALEAADKREIAAR
jgi:hypothetical protein